MSNGTVITIGRQFGSGGREIGKLVAQKLGIPFYDKDIYCEHTQTLLWHYTDPQQCIYLDFV